MLLQLLFMLVIILNSSSSRLVVLALAISSDGPEPEERRHRFDWNTVPFLMLLVFVISVICARACDFPKLVLVSCGLSLAASISSHEPGPKGKNRRLCWNTELLIMLFCRPDIRRYRPHRRCTCRFCSCPRCVRSCLQRPRVCLVSYNWARTKGAQKIELAQNARSKFRSFSGGVPEAACAECAPKLPCFPHSVLEFATMILFHAF